ncbi:putative sulfate exporter family transporter [Paenibacillus glycanilyticus]|uniref:YeiH family protein n=1 Tax=Paenibacillus glycanilyticus TaxID=126569 RepID=UPI00203DC402|nr:putative sulfate exporter family transporter [Paenibacillus glycanilyticus]MCM3627949.1 putative sulfate exporter family transporter [Paenibacillus glycanilyticus]
MNTLIPYALVPKNKRFLPLLERIAGLMLTAAIAAAAYGLARLPGLDHIGQMALALTGTIIARQFIGYPERLRAGIQFASKHLLKLAIILCGLRLNIGTLLHQGPALLLQGAVTVAFAIGCMLLIARKLKADTPLSLLLGIGTGICGAAAIAAVSPILKARDDDTAAGAGLIALIGTIAAIGYTALLPVLPLTEIQYGVWSGLTLHEIAHVPLAASAAGQEAVEAGLLAKLSRVLLLVPVSFILVLIMKRRGTLSPGTTVAFPWFLIGFVLMSVYGSLTPGTAMEIPVPAMAFLQQAPGFLLAMAMVGLGLNVDLRALRTKAIRPLAAMAATTVLLSAVTLLLIRFVY